MGIEIERKFLVKNELWRPEVTSFTLLRQGYLTSQNNAAVRVRVAGEHAFINIKSTTAGLQRTEFEYQIPLADAEAILDCLALRPLIEKTRHKIIHGQHTWELDVFANDNQGLVMAEVELASTDESFLLPPWAGQEVTGDPRYYNANLVKHPFTTW